MPPWNYDEDFGYNDDDPWAGEEGRGGGFWVAGDKADGKEVADHKPADAEAMAAALDDALGLDDDGQADEDDNPVVFEHTDCGGEGDTLTVMKMGDALWFTINDSPAVIIRDEQASDILYALIEFQDRNGDE
jgi:hypothetical protein